MKDLKPPREPVANLIYRKKLREWAVKSPKNRDWLLDKCKNEFFFFVESFCWLYEPRPEKNRPLVIPFIPWDHQYAPMRTILENLGYKDIGLEKARGEGATWSCTTIIQWNWLFYDMRAFGIVSKTEMSADNPEDPDSIGWKIDWQLTKLPLWMAGRRGHDYTRNVSKHTWLNKRNGSTITAYASTGDLASGGRKFAFFMDELAKFPQPEDSQAMSATEPVTNSRLLVSTYNGAEGEYYRIMKEPSSMIKLVMDWTTNPSRNQNLFRIDLQKRQLLHATSDLPIKKWDYAKIFFEDYLPLLQRRGFPVEIRTKLWSPWYVDRCLRPGMNPRKIAQEYDRDAGGSGSRFFPYSTIEHLCEKARRPEIAGDVTYNPERLIVTSFSKFSEGHLKIWQVMPDPTADFRPFPGKYVIGADVATGRGGTMSSNSALSIVNRLTGQKVAEYTNPNISPEKLAELAIALCRWFADEEGGPAYLVWECNGPGMGFRDRVLDTNFRNFHWRTPWKSTDKKPTKEAGWWSNKDAKSALLSKYRFALIEGHFDNPSELALRETLCYVDGANGKVEYVSDKGEDIDPSNDGDNHGDRVIADSLANLGREELNGGIDVFGNNIDPLETKKSTIIIPEGSFAHRQKQRIDQEKRKVRW